MWKFEIPATARTPEVTFDFAENRLKLAGESYPEDVTEFYKPVFGALDRYLETLGQGNCRVDIELIYLNSSSAKAIMMLMDKLDAAAANGASIDVFWFYDKEDDTMQELGEEFGEDLANAAFHLEKGGVMPSDDLFVAEEGVIAAAERLLADGGFDTAAEQQHFEKLLKSYQKLFRTARRLMRLGDHNERQLNAAADVIAQKNKELNRSPPSSPNISRRNLQLDLHRCARRRDGLQPQEAHHLLLRCGELHRDHRHPRIRGFDRTSSIAI